MPKMKSLATGVATVTASLIVNTAVAAGITGNSIEEITILGSRNALAGDPVTATEGVVTGTQLELRPISRIGELMEFVPGLVATQHSGEGKANQYFLRGFNLDHGTDFSINIDGQPVNMPTHAHGQGYADLNFLLPEMVEAMLYRKGPYYGNVGNFATAGSSDFAYRNALETGQISYVTGENEYHRLFLGNSITAGDGTLTLAGAATRYAGPWKRDQDLAKTNALIKYFSESSEARWSITAALYDGIWDSTDQIPLRAVQNNQLDELGNVDPTVGGDSHRYSVSFHREQLLGPGRLQVNGYLVDYQLDLYSNFTYFVEDPVRGDQFQQVDDRWISGFNAAYARPLNIVGTPGELTVGIQLRRDDADVGLFKTERRQAFATVRDDGFTETTLGTFASIDQTWNDYFRTEASLRLDHYRFDIDSGLPANSGKTNDTLVSPKLNLIFSPWNHTETFLSYGRGFHSNDARGTVITVDPASGDLVDAVDPLAKARGIEAGFRTAALPNTQLSASIFSLELDSELVYVGDAGATEALGASERRGIEIGLIHSPVAWFIVDADVTFTRARFSRAGSDDHIPLSVDRTASLGLLLDDLNGISGGLRFRYLGDAPLIEDDSVRSDSTFLVNLEASYRINPSWSVHLDVLNLFDSDDRDITYLYESQLPGEAEPVNDIHFHPVEPRAFRIGISGTF